MSVVFNVHMLPARQGDCLWIEYGDAQDPRRILVDGGTPGTYPVLEGRLKSTPKEQRSFELFIVTHIDSDHIGGTLPLLIDNDCEATFDDIWFNGWRHLPGSGLEEFGPVQGETLTTRLSVGDLSWNQAFDSKSIHFSETEALPVYDLPGGMRLTLLSPGVDELRRLRPIWIKECKAAGLVPGQAPGSSHPAPPGFEVMGPVNIDQLAQEDFSGDPSIANGSSIAVLAEFEGKRVLLAGDAHAEVLLESVKRLTPEGSRLRLEAFKLPHHGSKHNLSKELLEKLDCPRYLFSTDGTRFKHPDRQAAARVIKYGGEHPELMFNYRSQHNELWDNAGWMAGHGYEVTYPQEGTEGLLVEL